MQEYVTSKKSSSAHEQPKLGSGQEATGGNNTTPTGSPASSGDRRHADSVVNEEMHEQQAVLNQLKEVPIKSMNASLLVVPLLDHGEHILRFSRCLSACQAGKQNLRNLALHIGHLVC